MSAQCDSTEGKSPCSPLPDLVDPLVRTAKSNSATQGVPPPSQNQISQRAPSSNQEAACSQALRALFEELLRKKHANGRPPANFILRSVVKSGTTWIAPQFQSVTKNNQK